MAIKIWLKALRLPFLTATFVPVLLGSIIAWHSTGRFSWLYFMLTLTGISCLHLGTNLANDYFDHLTKNDELNTTPTPFSGGSRVIQSGEIRAGFVFNAALIFLSIGSLVGLYLNWKLHTNIILILGLIGVFCGFFYSAGPIRIGYRGIGEFIVGLCFGPLVVLGAYYVQASDFSVHAIYGSIPVGVLVGLVLYINEFPDYNADKLVNKKTLVVLLNKKRAVLLYHALLLFIYLYIAASVLSGILPVYMLAVFFTLPIAIKMYKVSKYNFNKVDELLPANAMTIGLHLAIGLLISAAFILDRIFNGA